MSNRSRGLGYRRALRSTLTAFALVLVPASLASAACPLRPTAQSYARFGDTAQYALVPGGSFELGTAGWTLVSSRVANGNDGFNVLPGAKSLAIGGGYLSASPFAISAPFCVDKTHPYFRFMLRPMGAVGALATFIIYRNSAGDVVRQVVGSKIATNIMPGYWRASELNPLSVNIPLLEAGGTATVQLGFLSPLSVNGPSYYIDNVMVDPYRRG
jgi:hypothetical protein